MTANFTHGPWELHESGAIVGPKIDDKPIWLRPVIARFETGVKREDALLMAAAPNVLTALQDFLEHMEQPPEANCRCHLSPPCNDCVEHGHMRELFKNGWAAVKQARGEK